MEWIETTGRTIDEAKEAALDELGVDETDAEFEVLAEPKSGLFGRVRVEARVRARVRPTAPRPKDDRRDRRRRRSGADAATATDAPAGEAAARAEAQPAAATPAAATPAGAARVGVTGRTAENEAAGHAGASTGAAEVADRQEHTAPAPAGGRRGGRTRRGGPATTDNEETSVNSVTVPLDEQAEEARRFVEGLLQEFGLAASVASSVDETEEVIEIAVTGQGLGLLIGPKGATLLAIQDLTRSAVQQKTGAGNGRLNVDVAGYRQKRTEALVRFAHQVAEQVKQSGARQALEPMTAADRKVIHDALTDVDGVTTISEGEDTARRVVVEPA